MVKHSDKDLTENVEAVEVVEVVEAVEAIEAKVLLKV